MTDDTAPQRLADIVASRPLWFRVRLATIMVWPITRGSWDAILSYAHYTKLRSGETAPPGINLTYPHDTHHVLGLYGEDLEAALMAQVRELESGEAFGHLVVKRVPEPPGKPLEGPPSTGLTILTHGGSDAERRSWESRNRGRRF